MKELKISNYIIKEYRKIDKTDLNVVYLKYTEFEEYLIETNQIYVIGKLPTFLDMEVVPDLCTEYVRPSVLKSSRAYKSIFSYRDKYYYYDCINKLNKIYLRDMKLNEILK